MWAFNPNRKLFTVCAMLKCVTSPKSSWHATVPKAMLRHFEGIMRGIEKSNYYLKLSALNIDDAVIELSLTYKMNNWIKDCH